MTANTVGVLALSLMVYGLVRKDNQHLLLLISAGVFLWAVHYGLMGSTSGAIVHVIAGFGVYLAHATYHASFRYRLLLAGIVSCLGVAGSLYTGITPANLLAAIGGVIMTASQYILRGTHMRQGFLLGEGVFFFFALIIGSVPGMLVTVINVGAGLLGLFRIHRARQSHPPSNKDILHEV